MCTVKKHLLNATRISWRHIWRWKVRPVNIDLYQYNIQVTECLWLWEFSLKMGVLRQILFSHTVTVQGVCNRLSCAAQTARKLMWIREYTTLFNTLNLIDLGSFFVATTWMVFFCEVNNLDIIVFIVFPAVRE